VTSHAQQLFPFLPGYSTWEEFNGNLVMFYSQNNISFNDEANWDITAREIAQSPAFQRFGTPDPQTYDNWEDWALEFNNLVNSNIRK
jgi:hypothetical protein